MPCSNGVQDEGDEKAKRLIEEGVEVFVNLTTVSRRGSHEAFADSHKYKQFEVLVRQMLNKLRKKAKADTFISCPSPDGSAPPDRALADILRILLAQISERRPVYVHCYEGKGRTGLVACCLMCLLFPNLAPERARDLFNALLDTRTMERARRNEPRSEDTPFYDPRHFPHADVQWQSLMRLKRGEGPFAPVWTSARESAARDVVGESLLGKGERHAE